VLGGLAAEQGAAGLPAALRHPGHDGRRPLRVEPADGQVVQHEQGRGAGDHHVVDHHRHQVDPDGVVAVQRAGDQQLGADPVGGGGQHAVGVLGPIQRPQPGEAADAAEHPRPVGGLDRGAHQLDRPLAGGHVHPGRGVGQRVPAHEPGAIRSSSALPCA
jgi:hypothetical protein